MSPEVPTGLESTPLTLLPADRYLSPDVLTLERRRLFAGGWTCLGRLEDLFDDGATQRAAMVGDVGVLLTRSTDRPRMFANTCRHRGHELLPEGGASGARAVTCPYHAWSYDLDGRLLAAPSFPGRGADRMDKPLAELPLELWHGWVFGHALHRLGSPEVPDFAAYVGDLETVVSPYRPEELHPVARHTYEVAANWKVLAENYHECYHCPQIHPELCAVSPPNSGANYDLPGTWVGGAMDLRDGMATMSLTGESAGRPIPDAPAGRVEYVHLMPNLLISAHPDYVMTHRLVPLAPDRTWVECSWLMPDGVSDPSYAVDFWDLTNKQDWAACESVQRGLANPHFEPGPLAPGEDALARFTGLVLAAYDED